MEVCEWRLLAVHSTHGSPKHLLKSRSVANSVQKLRKTRCFPVILRDSSVQSRFGPLFRELCLVLLAVMAAWSFLRRRMAALEANAGGEYRELVEPCATKRLPKRS